MAKPSGWKHQTPASDKGAFLFKGRRFISPQADACLSTNEIEDISQQLKAYVLENGSVDYIQSFKHPKKSFRVLAIDEHDQHDLDELSESCTPEELSGFNFWVLTTDA